METIEYRRQESGGKGAFSLTVSAARSNNEAFQVLRVENGLQALVLQG